MNEEYPQKIITLEGLKLLIRSCKEERDIPQDAKALLIKYIRHKRARLLTLRKEIKRIREDLKDALHLASYLKLLPPTEFRKIKGVINETKKL